MQRAVQLDVIAFLVRRFLSVGFDGLMHCSLCLPFDLHHTFDDSLHFNLPLVATTAAFFDSPVILGLDYETMAESDRSRSPVPGRNRAEPVPPRPPVRQDLPFFPRWCGPMQSAIWHSQQMLRPQSRPQFQPQFTVSQRGPYMMNTSTNPSTSMNAWQNPRFPSANPRFPPAPPSSPPPTLAYPIPSKSVTPPCSPTIPCAPTQLASPSTPSIPSSQPRHPGTPF